MKNIETIQEGAIVEKIKEKAIPLALAIVLIDIAYLILKGLIKIVYAFLSSEIRTNTFDRIFFGGTKIFQFELALPLGIFLILSSYLQNFETHAKNLRSVGIITVLFMHFGNFLSFLMHGKTPAPFPILFVLYGALLLSFYSKKWLPMSMIVLGAGVVYYYGRFIYLPFGHLVLWDIAFGLVVAIIGIINLGKEWKGK